jgi:hypothetical protein
MAATLSIPQEVFCNHPLLLLGRDREAPTILDGKIEIGEL